jgi:hypothetical protein
MDQVDSYEHGNKCLEYHIEWDIFHVAEDQTVLKHPALWSFVVLLVCFVRSMTYRSFWDKELISVIHSQQAHDKMEVQ